VKISEVWDECRAVKFKEMGEERAMKKVIQGSKRPKRTLMNPKFQTREIR